MLGHPFKSGEYDLVNNGLINSRDLAIMVILIGFIVVIEVISELVQLRKKFNNSNIVIRYSLLIALLFVINYV